MAEQILPGQTVEWSSTLFGALSGVVQRVLEDRIMINQRRANVTRCNPKNSTKTALPVPRG